MILPTTTQFRNVNMGAEKIDATDVANYVSTVAERSVARSATGVFTIGTKHYASIATIGRARLMAVTTKAITFVQNPH